MGFFKDESGRVARHGGTPDNFGFGRGTRQTIKELDEPQPIGTGRGSFNPFHPTGQFIERVEKWRLRSGMINQFGRYSLFSKALCFLHNVTM